MSRRFLVSLLITSIWTLGGCGVFTDPGPATYALIKLRHDATRIEMVALMETFGEGACEASIRRFMEEFHDDDGEEWRQTDRSCQQTLDPLYQRVFNKERFHATYIVISPETHWDVESRIVLFGIPSTQAQSVCEQVANEVGSRLEVAVECVQGTVV